MSTKNNEVLKNPLEMYPHEEFPMQKQNPPGLNSKMNPVPDSGEKTYVGHGRLQGRKALITGGDSGIGRAVAIAFAREGADVAINYMDIEQEDAQSLAELLKEENIEIKLLPGDIKDEQTCYNIVKDAYEQLGGLDVLVLNSAVQVAQWHVEDITAEQLVKTFETNVYAPIYMTKAAIPLLPAGSSIIFTGSAEYFTPNRVLLDYAASKFAVIGFCRALSKQVLEKGIRVNAVCPGPVWTPLEVSGGNPDEWITKHGIDTPFGRPGQPVELAGIYVHLASNESTYSSGEIYGVTGGLSA